MAEPAKQDAIVSSEDEELILVDEHDTPIGHLDKASCHDGAGILHRAFSLFLFDSEGRTLLQQRAAGKRLWPGYWSNSCCSHPRRSESMEEAVERRLDQELGVQAQLHFLYKFRYQAAFETLGSEHELCWVYAGRCDQRPVVNSTEISNWRWLPPAELEHELNRYPERFTPWFKLEWARLQADHQAFIRSL